ncbi:MAG: Sir2 family NAD-dependent protein deacetylase [Dehalococcoidia bacterium]|nr:Sir2 family NAD-dependent protein deacetylase [Dehalococcoidia bacterium]
MSETTGQDTQEMLDQVAAWLREASRPVVLTGAGISTDSGIPDFRGPQGLWTKNPEAEKKATIQHWMSSTEARQEGWQRRMESASTEVTPNPGHIALFELEQKGKLDTLVTQNVDGLHLDAGNSRERVIEIHGTTREFMCMNCPDRGPIDRVLARVADGDTDPACRSCGGVLKSATISFGQNLVREDLERAERAAASCDMFLAIGTTLTVYPVALMPERAVTNGARLVILNAQETPFDPYASAVLRGSISEVLPDIVERV